MSNKVEMADRSLLRARAHEPTGEVESLRGRTDVGRMGDRIATTTGKSRPLELQEKLQRKKHKTEAPAKESIVHASGGQSILDYDNLTGYQPTTQRARGAYETLLVRNTTRLSLFASGWINVYMSSSHFRVFSLSCLSHRQRFPPRHSWEIKQHQFSVMLRMK